MRKRAAAVLGVATLGWLAMPAKADQMAASCATLINISAEEADYIYYLAQGDLGAETANRLWAVYHRLRHRCGSRPWARVVVNVEPGVKAFLEAHR